jgi:hypothetical protein
MCDIVVIGLFLWIFNMEQNDVPADHAKLSQELHTITEEYKEIDKLVELLSNDDSSSNNLELARLKKKLLQIKGRMNIIESILYPDIIA